MKTKQWQLSGMFGLILLLLIPFTAHAEVTDNPYHLFEGNDASKNEVKISSQETSEENVYDRRLLVKLHEGHSFNPANYHVDIVDNSTSLEEQDILIVRIPEAYDYVTIQKEIEADQQVVYAEPDYKVETSYTPSEDILTNQWYLKKIKMSQAWQLNQGSKEVKVAVLDTGVNKSHPDLKHRVLPGYDYINNDNSPNDDHGHGTRVAGIIAANASTSMTGLDLHTSILPVKVIDSDGNGPSSSVVKGIEYAIKKNVDVINMSYVNYSHSKMEEDALWKAYRKGIVLVAAAGNEGWGRSGYPASYTPVISTSATDKKDNLAAFSNYGSHIDIAAPGVDIFSLNYKKGYTTGSGSSFSAPIVSSLSSMLVSQHPNWKPEDVEWALESSTDKIKKTEWNPQYGYGRINALKTFEARLPYKQTKQTDYKQASTLVNNRVAEGTLTHPLDVNWFTFNLAKAKNVSITLSELANHLDLAGTLYKYEDNKLHKALSFNSGQRGETENASITLKSGTYYLAVHDTFGKWSTKPYVIKIAEKPATQIFPDVTRYNTEISYLTNRGIIRGFPNNTFQPNKEITRLQAVQMMLHEMKINVDTYQAPDPKFKDIHPGSTGYHAIAAAVDLGFVKGKDNNTFDSYGYLTRAQLAAMMVSAYQLTGESSTMFKDVGPDHWAHEVINTLLANDITKGYEDNTFRPNKPMTRAHFSVLLYNKMKNVK